MLTRKGEIKGIPLYLDDNMDDADQYYIGRKEEKANFIVCGQEVYKVLLQMERKNKLERLNNI